MLVHRRATPSIKFAGTHLYTWVERGTVREKCLAQEHNTMTPARAQTQTARSRVKRTNHEATMHPHRCGPLNYLSKLFILQMLELLSSLFALNHFMLKLDKSHSVHIPLTKSVIDPAPQNSITSCF